MQDAAACLLQDGLVVAAVEEERLSRKKHTGSFPESAIRWCLEEAGVGPQALNHVAFNMRPWQGLGGRFRHIVSDLPRSMATWNSRGGNFLRMLSVARRFRSDIGRGPYRWHWVPHHDAHAASAFYPSGFDSAAVLIVDGSGELAATTRYHANSQGLKLLGSNHFPHSLGYFYSALTQWLGFQPTVAEGKTMGLSAYASVEPALLSQFGEMISDDGHVDPSWFEYQFGGDRYYSARWMGAFGEPRVPESEFTDRHYAIAAAGQRRLEEILFHQLRELHSQTHEANVCLAGGVALNCVANGKILEETPFTNVFVQPVAHDAGTAWGAALEIHCSLLGGHGPGRQTTVAWGPSYGAKRIDAAIAASALKSDPQDPAALLAEGCVVGWFTGRCELGPRALGWRSILADPRNEKMPDKVNTQVKHRETFRPFAPAVLEEAVHDWFEGLPSPFMTSVMRVRPEKQSLIPAITHVDGTARVQTVSRETNPKFYALIDCFRELTGIPMVLNTSFNRRGEPIVCTPEEAVADFLDTQMDALVLEDRVLIKS